MRHGKVVRPVSGTDPVTKSAITGQEVVFRTKAKNGVVLTKTFRLFPNTHGLEVELKFESPDKERRLSTTCLVLTAFRSKGNGTPAPSATSCLASSTGRKSRSSPMRPATSPGRAANPIDNTALPLVFAGVENQYFAILVQPDPIPTGESGSLGQQDDRLDCCDKNEKAIQKSDVGVRITSKPISSRPQPPVSHNYRVFAGPKTVDALKRLHAEGLAIYRKNQWIPHPVRRRSPSS